MPWQLSKAEQFLVCVCFAEGKNGDLFALVTTSDFGGGGFGGFEPSRPHGLQEKKMGPGAKDSIPLEEELWHWKRTWKAKSKRQLL